MVEYLHSIRGGANLMDAIDQALAQVKSEIEHTRTYLAKLLEAESELITAQEARHTLAQGWNSPRAPEAAIPDQNPVREIPTVAPVGGGEAPQTQPPLSSEIIRLLGSGNRAMTPAEIDAELRATGRHMHENAVTSTLSKLVKRKVLVKRPGARYALPSQAGKLLTVLEGLPEKEARRSRPPSIATQAYNILREAGRPLTVNEIVAVFQERGQDVNRRSVMTSLYHWAQDGQFFRLLGPKTFGLLEWPEQPISPKEMMGGMLFTEGERHFSTNSNNQQQ
jgi:HB1, ASXL, restriction endonuclease HTH domain